MPLKLTIKVKRLVAESCTAYRRQCCQMYFDGLDGRTCQRNGAVDTGEGIKVPVGEENTSEEIFLTVFGLERG